MTKKSLFIHAVGMVKFEEQESIPTILRYQKDKGLLIGNEALIEQDSSEFINEDFKIQIGKFRPGQASSTREKFPCDDGINRSSNNLAKDYFDKLIHSTSEHLNRQGLKNAPHVLVSEPLSFFASNDVGWLENYRGNLRRILSNNFEDIHFLPEPFAVYQYYRYGVKHDLVTQERKHCALVIDFGGGTFDVSVIETTNAGDIAKSGKHARPLGAHSKPVGGFEINRQFAKVLLEEAYAKTEDIEKIKKGLENYFRWQKGELDIEQLSSANKIYLRWLGGFLRKVEIAKITLAKQITNWQLDVNLTGVYKLDIPSEPFVSNSDTITLRVTAQLLQKLFVNEIWHRRLKSTVTSALKYAKSELDSRPMDLVLLSGGSANLRWLEDLLIQDFKDELSSAQVVSLRESYQEVVAKGLAIECARRGYEPNSEFTDVTYNPLYLVLNPDKNGLQIKRFKLLDKLTGIKKPSKDGELLTAAESMEMDQELDVTWKVRLDRPPKHQLEYYFLRDSIDVEDCESRYNVVESKLVTPRNIHFDSTIKVNLKIREDGTCTPTFVYRTDQLGKPADFVTGLPFCIDLVTADQKANRDAYIGIDFGTATSAVSYIDWDQVQTFERRKKEAIWLSLNELVQLPTPISVPLKALIGSTKPEVQWRVSMEALEAILSFSSFICWAEATATNSAKVPKCFNKNWKRSAGPLKKLLVDLVNTRIKGNFLDVFRKKLTKEIQSELNHVIQAIDDEKHQKQEPGNCDAKPILEKLGNICKEALGSWVFGYFEDVKQSGFSHQFNGGFRIAIGSPPYQYSIPYTGSSSFSESEAVLVNLQTGDVLTLTPLIFWNRSIPSATWQQCMLFDGIGRKGDINFKEAGVAKSISLKDYEELIILDEMILKLCDSDISADLIAGGNFSIDPESDLYNELL